MPVLVVAAHRPLARAIALRLLDEGGQVRAVAPDAVGELRAAGIHVAAAQPDDVGRIEAAATRVHTVVHLAGGLGGADPARVLAEGEAVVGAAEGAGARRLVLVTAAGASAAAPEPLRRTHAAIESLALAATVPSVIVRAPLVDTPRTRALLRGLASEERLDGAALPLVRGDDLVELVVALDRARSTAREGHVVLAATPASTIGIGAFARGGRLGGVVLPAEARARTVAALAGGWSDPETALPDAWALMGVPVRAVTLDDLVEVDGSAQLDDPVDVDVDGTPGRGPAVRP